ncbi:MAG: hypothetical protein KJ630_01330 [Proteobacteria bacterium]|nr:hypothetical protein [Pseudomonadota bacterium]
MKMNKRPSRKPMNKLNGFDSREAIWKLIREKTEFTVREIYLDTTLDASSVLDYVRGLTNAGYLREETGEKAKLYTLIKDVGVDAPRVQRDGSLVTQGQGRINMWRAMQIMQVFTAKELAINASTPQCAIKLSSADDYCGHLCRAGYLRRDNSRRYTFLRHMFTGPKPPMIQRVKRVWDQNLKKVMWSEDGGSNDGE